MLDQTSSYLNAHVNIATKYFSKSIECRISRWKLPALEILYHKKTIIASNRIRETFDHVRYLHLEEIFPKITADGNLIIFAFSHLVEVVLQPS